MEYKLNDYHRNLSDDELLEDLRIISEKHEGKYISRSIYEREGKFSATPFLSRWGSWIAVLQAAGLRTERTSNEYKRISNSDIVKDMNRVASVLKKDTVTTKEYYDYGTYKVQTVLTRFGSWNEALKQAKLIETGYKVITNEDLFAEIERLWQIKGCQPTSTDIKNGLSKYSLNTYSRRFGGWRNALLEFLKYIDESDEPSKTEEMENNYEEIKPTENTSFNKIIKQRKTSRDVNVRLRFKVLSRDRFTCCACGASPAKDPSVVLHVDHIIPWSKGGETEINNLQTLCSKCNLGKSDML